MNPSIYRIGFGAMSLAALATIGFCIVQALQLYNVLVYPNDEKLIFGFSLCITIPFLIGMLAFHYSVAPEKRFWSHIALLFTLIYVIFVTANYVVQLATVIPMTMNDHGAEIEILSQGPHSMFWDYDAIGYIFMGLAALFAFPAFDRIGFSGKVRYAFLAHACVTPIIMFVYFSPHFSLRLLLIGCVWGITAPLSMILLAVLFLKGHRHNVANSPSY